MLILEDYYRHDILNMLEKGSLGIELGVAEGVFSSRMVESGKFDRIYAVDMYGDKHHPTEQYKRALLKVGLDKPYSLFRMRFDEALDMFPDEFFDFIYVDGFAHTGEENGQTLYDWYPKLKKGGLFAGDDYHKDWPKVVKAVDKFCAKYDYSPMVTGKTEDIDFCKYPTWAIIKK